MKKKYVKSSIPWWLQIPDDENIIMRNSECIVWQNPELLPEKDWDWHCLSDTPPNITWSIIRQGQVQERRERVQRHVQERRERAQRHVQERRGQRHVQEEQKKPEIPPHFLETFLLKKEEERECLICLETMSKNVYMTPCFHFFHINCMNSVKTCPVCRKELH